MDAAAQAAVGAGDDVFLADDFSERDDAIGYELRVLDEVRGVAGLGKCTGSLLPRWSGRAG